MIRGKARIGMGSMIGLVALLAAFTLASPASGEHVDPVLFPDNPTCGDFNEDWIELKVDPVEYRLRHLRDPRLRQVVATATKSAGWEARPSPRAAARRTGVVLIPFLD